MSEPGADTPRSNLTYADYAALPDDGRRYQLVEGELVVTPAPTQWHQHVVMKLGSSLDRHVDEHRLGRVLAAPCDVILDDHNVVQPDILFVSNARFSIVRDANIAGAPDLCVEILSPSSIAMDRVRKLALYARFGVPHYWIVDLEAKSIEEWMLDGELYRPKSVTSVEQVFRPALFPGFEFSLGPLGLP